MKIEKVEQNKEIEGFIEKCGFELEFVRKNKTNPKLDKYFYVKYF